MKCLAIAVVLAVAACGPGGGKAGPGGGRPMRAPTTLAERIIALLPDGAQVLVEIDLARLKANAVVGELARMYLAQLGEDSRLPGMPIEVQGSPLGAADVVVLAAYGVGTAQAASVVVLATKAEVTGGIRLAPDLVALGPDEWTSQLAARASIAEHTAIAPSLALMPLRDHAMPAKAPGAVFRLTAQLPFDARVALARQTGLPTAPAQISVWADIVDDVAVIIDTDAADPGDNQAKDATERLSRALAVIYDGASNEPALRALGLTSALREPRIITERTWVRTIFTVGPRQLRRAVERARVLLTAPSAGP